MTITGRGDGGAGWRGGRGAGYGRLYQKRFAAEIVTLVTISGQRAGGRGLVLVVVLVLTC